MTCSWAVGFAQGTPSNGGSCLSGRIKACLSNGGLFRFFSAGVTGRRVALSRRAPPYFMASLGGWRSTESPRRLVSRQQSQPNRLYKRWSSLDFLPCHDETWVKRDGSQGRSPAPIACAIRRNRPCRDETARRALLAESQIRTLPAARPGTHGWSPRRCVPHGGHQFALNIAVGPGCTICTSARKFCQGPLRLLLGVLPSPVVPIDVQPPGSAAARAATRTTTSVKGRSVMTLACARFTPVSTGPTS
jgi:hypothetical protein